MSVTHLLGEPPRAVAVVRALPGLGDLLCAVPALRALRAALPHAQITLVGLPSARGFVERFGHYIDELLVCPGFPGLVSPPHVELLPAFLAEAQARRFDLALQLHGSGVTSNPFTVLLGARHCAGCFLPGQYCPDPARFLPLPEDDHEIRRALAVLEHLGVPLQGEQLEFPLGPGDRASLAALPEAGALAPGTYVCVHPGASTPLRRWSPAGFAAAADALAQRGLAVVLTGGAAEAELTGAVARAMRSRAIDLASRTDLGTLAALLGGSRLLLSNDTGVAHLGVALRTPSVTVFAGESADPAHMTRWAPLDTARHRAVPAPTGTDALPAVLEAVDSVIGRERAAAAD
ncbi:MAG TPA: glycosyltransferase family 9 protein [Roseiflexaceae bacterium]|nr:glycosyltransferase family 9 protein [Roseiflexaceae bacterium]